MKELAGEIIDKARKKGADETEFFFTEASNTSVEVKDGKIDAMQTSSEKGFSLRVLNNKSMGFSFTSDPSKKALNSLLDSALFSAESVTEDSFHTLPTGPFEYPDVKTYDDTFPEITIEEKVDWALKIEEAAYAFDKRVRAVRQAAYSDSSGRSFIMNSNGVISSEKDTFFMLSVMIAAEEKGESESGYYFSMGVKRDDLLSPKEVGEKAAKMAVSMLGAEQAKTVKTTVVLDPLVGCGLIDAFSPVFSADFLQKGKSLLKGKIGKRIASKAFTIIDDGCLAEGLNSSASDGEGVPSQKTVLVSEGVATSFLYDCYTANKDGVESTGNGMRGGFKNLPSVSPSNLFLLPGSLSKNELISEVSDGLYVLEAMGLHTIDPISGDFSIGISGYWIEKGKISFPVRGAVISGNVLDLFKKVDAVSNKCSFVNNVGSPSIRIRDVDICG